MELIFINLSVSFMICVTLTIRKVFRKKIPQITFLWIWIVIALKLVLPIKIDSMFSIFNLPIFTDSVSITKNFMKNNMDMNQLLIHIHNNQQQNSVFHVILLCCWLIGFCMISIYFIIQYQKTKKEILNSYPFSNSLQLEQERKSLNLPQNIIIVQNKCLYAPAVWGIKNPKIILPETFCFQNTKAVQYILLHEYGHIKYRHALIKIFSIFLLSLYWYNPFIWILYFYLDKDMEIMADTYVLKYFHTDHREEYAICLLNAIKEHKNRSIFYYHYKKNFIKERVEMIMNFKKLTIGSLITAVLISLSVVAVFATTDVTLTYSEMPSNAIITPIYSDEYHSSDISSMAHIYLNENEATKYIKNFDEKWTNYYDIEGYEYVTYGKIPPKTLYIELNRYGKIYSGYIDRQYYVYEDEKDKYVGFYDGRIYAE